MGLLPRRYWYAHLFWSWIWLVSIPIGIALIVWINTWMGIGVIVVGLALPSAIKQSAAQFVLWYACENEDFYNAIVLAGILIVEEKQIQS